MASRFPIAILPKDRQFFEGDVNVTVHVVAAEIVKSFNLMSLDGLKVSADEHDRKRAVARPVHVFSF